jgi:hypothetical protein
MWTLESTTQYERDFKWYGKKHPKELAAVLRNLCRYQQQLDLVDNAALVKAGYIHDEPHGVVAIDQKGGGSSLQETRLYAYPDQTKNLIYLITIGNKDTQQDDLNLCRDFVEQLDKQNES